MSSRRLAEKLADTVIEVRRAEAAEDEKAGRQPDFSHASSRDDLVNQALSLPGHRVREMLRINQRHLAEMRERAYRQVYYDRVVNELQGLFGSD